MDVQNVSDVVIQTNTMRKIRKQSSALSQVRNGYFIDFSFLLRFLLADLVQDPEIIYILTRCVRAICLETFQTNYNHRQFLMELVGGIENNLQSTSRGKIFSDNEGVHKDFALGKISQRSFQVKLSKNFQRCAQSTPS